MPRKILVAVDGSKNGDWAFHAAVHGMDPGEDYLFLISVAQITTINGLQLVKSVLTQGIHPRYSKSPYS